MFVSKSTQTIKTKVGAIWEEYPWSLEVDYEDAIPLYSEFKPCSHAIRVGIVEGEDFDKGREIYRWPFVIIAYNEGKCNSTGVCGLCIYEQIERVKIEQLLSQLHTIRK